jgi:long-chain acyl-CoA synthetase
VTAGVSAGAARHPDKPALVAGDEQLSYAELDDRSTRLAHWLREQGAEGGVVAGMLPNGFAFVETAVASGKAGARFLPVNWHLRSDEVRHLLVDSGAVVLVVDPASLPAARAALPAVDGPRLVVTGEQYDAIVAAAPSQPALPSGPAWQPMFYTSGTTGRPKGVVHSGFDPSRAALAQDMQAALWKWTPDDVFLMCGPAYHASHCGWAMTALYVGATTVLMPSWDARDWLALVERHRATRSFMVPAHFIRVLEVPEAERSSYDLSSLRIVVHGGAPCPVDVKRRFLSTVPAEVWELYGGSEGGATAIGPDEWLAHPGSVGRPWPGTEVRVLDGTGAPVGVGETGLVYIRPAGGLRFSYHGDPAKTEQAWVDDAFTVGDIGHLDADGYLYLTDRASDLVIRGGVNIYPREVEEALHRHPGVVDCAVFGVPDDRNGEELAAVVEARPGVTADDLRAHLSEAVARFKVPRDITLTDALPRDPNGKVLKRLLREGSHRTAGTRPGA